jgi:hypothetical protein
MMKFIKAFCIYLPIYFLGISAFGQISPGELSEPHAHLEGMSNCTQCHDLGKHVSDQKCLSCHTELKTRIDQKKGFHSSSKVGNKGCISCHSEHLSRKYDIVHLEKDKFNHQDAGWALEGKHKEKKCQDCHKTENITDPLIKKKKVTYLGLSTTCLTCHEDKHQKTLSTTCTECHSFEAFKPAKKFDHNKSKFVLKGKHIQVECKKCHEIDILNGKEYQKFKGIEFGKGCVNCHKDEHENKFGQNCAECHSEESFKILKSAGKFDHNKTNFKLEDKHVNVDCKKCHKGSLTAPLLHKRCADCHTDYHKGQFTKKSVLSDCKDCHSTRGFVGSSFTLERHNKTSFKLEGAHLATPCFSCHKKEKDWQFGEMPKRCVACHSNIHKGFIGEKYNPEEQCDKCHGTSSWGKVTFNHNITTFELKGKHLEKSCRDCHFKKGTDNQLIQQFSSLTGNCENCHTDIHQKQFTINDKLDCTTCHGGFENWKADRFNHNTTRFKLDGGHLNVECKKCHLENKSGLVPFIQYKNTKMECLSCHLK